VATPEEERDKYRKQVLDALKEIREAQKINERLEEENKQLTLRIAELDKKGGSGEWDPD